MHAANPTFPVNYEKRRPGLDLVSIPGCIVVVGYNRVLDTQRGHFAAHVVDVPLFCKLRGMNAHDGQASLAVLFVPALDVGQSIAAVVTTKSPKLDQDDAAAKTLQRLGV